MNYLLFASIVLFPGLAFSQEARELRHVTTPLYYADFYIELESKKIKYADTLYYYWFKSQALHSSQGYAAGYLLNGPFIQYYASGQLAEQGEFELGLKTGEWKSWYESGQLEAVQHYEEGILNGPFFRYNEEGKLVASGTCKAGHLHGDVMVEGTVTNYKHGQKKERNKKSEAASDGADLDQKQKRSDREPSKKQDNEKVEKRDAEGKPKEKKHFLKRWFKKEDASEVREPNEKRTKKSDS